MNHRRMIRRGKIIQHYGVQLFKWSMPYTYVRISWISKITAYRKVGKKSNSACSIDEREKKNSWKGKQSYLKIASSIDARSNI